MCGRIGLLGIAFVLALVLAGCTAAPGTETSGRAQNSGPSTPYGGDCQSGNCSETPIESVGESLGGAAGGLAEALVPDVCYFDEDPSLLVPEFDELGEGMKSRIGDEYTGGGISIRPTAGYHYNDVGQHVSRVEVYYDIRGEKEGIHIMIYDYNLSEGNDPSYTTKTAKKDFAKEYADLVEFGDAYYLNDTATYGDESGVFARAERLNKYEMMGGTVMRRCNVIVFITVWDKDNFPMEDIDRISREVDARILRYGTT